MNNNVKFLPISFFSIVALVVLIDLSTSLFTKKSFLAFRAWESMLSETGTTPFKPNSQFEQLIHGDLANFLKVWEFRKLRHQRFSTDYYGYRNKNLSADTYYPIVVVGDSNMVGSSSSDEEIYSAQLSDIIGVSVYNFAPNHPFDVLKTPRFAAQPPKVVIWDMTERLILSRKEGVEYAHVSRSLDPLTHSRSINLDLFLTQKLSQHYAQWAFGSAKWALFGLSQFTNAHVGFVSQDPLMLFYAEGLSVMQKNLDERGLLGSIEMITWVHRVMQKNGVTMIFLPIPDRENIYSHYLPEDSYLNRYGNQFLTALAQGLTENQVPNINLLAPFKEVADDELLYYFDDTHWNSSGIKLAADLTAEYLYKDLDLEATLQK